MPLLDLRGPPAADIQNPSAAGRWAEEAELAPGHRQRGMFDYPSPRSNRMQCRPEASAVVTDSMAVSCLVYRCHLAPAVAGRMRDYRMRSAILPRVALDVP
jgi:hypothetical protein